MSPLQIQVGIVIDLSPATVSLLSSLFAAHVAAGEAIDKARETAVPAARSRGKKPTTEASEPVQEPPATEASEPPPPVEKAAPSGALVTVEQVRAAIAEFAQKDRAQARALLKKFGADSVSSLKQEHYAAVLLETRS